MSTCSKGARHEAKWTVGEADTAVALGSGSVRVLGTPRMIAWMEACAANAIAHALPSGTTTVGTEVAVRHLAPSPVGSEVTVVARLVESSGRRWVFEVGATDDTGRALADGTHTRVTVQAAGFGG